MFFKKNQKSTENEGEKREGNDEGSASAGSGSGSGFSSGSSGSLNSEKMDAGANSDIDVFLRSLPTHLRFGMIADCHGTPLQMDTTVGSLSCLRLRMCHISEWNVFLQVCSLQRDVNRKEKGLFSKIFGRKSGEYKTAFSNFDGDLPFNLPRLIGSQY